MSACNDDVIFLKVSKNYLKARSQIYSYIEWPLTLFPTAGSRLLPPQHRVHMPEEKTNVANELAPNAVLGVKELVCVWGAQAKSLAIPTTLHYLHTVRARGGICLALPGNQFQQAKEPCSSHITPPNSTQDCQGGGQWDRALRTLPLLISDSAPCNNTCNYIKEVPYLCIFMTRADLAQGENVFCK